jgi:hypothetical protein
VAGVPCVTAGVPVAAPGDVVVEGLCVVAGEVLVAPGWVPVAPGCVVVVLGVVVWPIPGLGVTVPVFCATATPTASANTDDAIKIFRIEACSLSELLRPNCQGPRGIKTFLLAKPAFSVRCAGRHERWRSRVAGYGFPTAFSARDGRFT